MMWRYTKAAATITERATAGLGGLGLEGGPHLITVAVKKEMAEKKGR
jgi:hypothetical protein